MGLVRKSTNKSLRIKVSEGERSGRKTTTWRIASGENDLKNQQRAKSQLTVGGGQTVTFDSFQSPGEDGKPWPKEGAPDAMMTELHRKAVVLRR